MSRFAGGQKCYAADRWMGRREMEPHTCIVLYDVVVGGRKGRLDDDVATQALHILIKFLVTPE